MASIPPTADPNATNDKRTRKERTLSRKALESSNRKPTSNSSRRGRSKRGTAQPATQPKDQTISRKSSSAQNAEDDPVTSPEQAVGYEEVDGNAQDVISPALAGDASRTFPQWTIRYEIPGEQPKEATATPTSGEELAATVLKWIMHNVDGAKHVLEDINVKAEKRISPLQMSFMDPEAAEEVHSWMLRRDDPYSFRFTVFVTIAFINSIPGNIETLDKDFKTNKLRCLAKIADDAARSISTASPQRTALAEDV